MKSQTVHMTDNYDSLVAGDDYIMLAPTGAKRRTTFTSLRTGKVTSLYAFQVEHAKILGRLHVCADEPKGENMTGAAVARLCHETVTHYIY